LAVSLPEESHVTIETTWNPLRTPARLIRFVSLAGLGVIATSALAAGQADPQTQATFTKDIAPILQRSCQNCHRPQAIAPMSLITYEDARPWASAIKRKTVLREMPPWFIEKNIGIQKFKDDPSLSDEEIATLAKWTDTGAPRGNSADMPPPRQFADGTAWSIGTPDLIVSSSVVTVKAVAPDYFGPLGQTPIGLMEDRYIKAVEVKEVRLNEARIEKVAGRADLNLFVVHHAQISSEPSILRAADNAPQTPEGRRTRGGFSYTHEVGQNALIYPDDAGVLLTAGAALDFPNVHVHSAGKDVPVRLDVAFKLHPKGYKPKYVISNLGSFGTELLDIPAGQDNVRFDAFYTMGQAANVLTFEPHMHARGKRMCVEAIYPSAQREMLNCAGYNHNWVKVYAYEDDATPLLPAGTIMHIIGWYDNTAKNPRNPEPRNWAGFGSRSIDDMFYNLARVVFLTEEEFNNEVIMRQKRLSKARTTQH
jgi:hypothetical protein